MGSGAAASAVSAAIAATLRRVRPPTTQWGCGYPRPCRQIGLRIPEDIALLGVDDDDLLCGLAHPPLSSIRTPLERIGYEAGKLLAHLIAGGKDPKRPLLFPPMQVVTRGSTDVLAIADPDLAAAIRFIQQNAHRRVGIKQLIDQVALSRRSLERKFRKAFKRSPFEELLRVRLQRAKDLLSASDLPMSSVAEQTGFGTGKRPEHDVPEPAGYNADRLSAPAPAAGLSARLSQNGKTFPHSGIVAWPTCSYCLVWLAQQIWSPLSSEHL